MTRNPIVPTLFCLLVALAAAGCGDASADETFASQCQRMCAHGDACPNLVAQPDCVANCEEAVADAAALGGTCPGLLDEVISCQQRLSCSELTDRARGGFYDDQCVVRDEALRQCVPGDRVPSDDGTPDGVGELALACQAACDAFDACPRTRAEVNCLEICIDGFGGLQNGEEDCTDALVDSLNCQAGLTCAELEDRAVGRGLEDGCTDVDRWTARLCI